MAFVVATQRMGYDEAWQIQRALAEARRAGRIPDVLWLLEHPPVYTFGRHGKREDLWVDDATLAALGASCVHSDRGGLMTWHGPGQTTGYVIADVRDHGGVRRFVHGLVQAMATASGLDGVEVDDERMGAYIDGRKLGSVGIRVSAGITTHGVALNRDPDLIWYERMSACGAPDVAATSIAAEGGRAMRAVVEGAFAHALGDIFNLMFDPIELDELCSRCLLYTSPSPRD